MSEAVRQVTDILLPDASIYIFSNDEETLSSAAQLEGDWRFARVDVSVHKGDVNTALMVFEGKPSPDLIIIQTDDINESFTDKLGELSGYCDEHTAAIVVGPVNDVYLYRELINMGVSDYLVRPIKSEVLKEIVAKALISRLGLSDSCLVAFVGAKGGVGTSSLAHIAALNASRALGQKVLLMDAAGGWSSLSVGAGFDPSATLHEVAQAVEANNEDALGRMFYKDGGKLSILASGADAMLDPLVSAVQYEKVLDNIMVKSPLVFVDLSGASASIKKAVIARAHLSVIVTTPTVTSLRFCRSLIKELSVIRGGKKDDLCLVVNMQGVSKPYEVGKAAISEALELEPALSIAYMPSLFVKYESEIEKMLSDKEGGELKTAFLPILGRVLSGDAAANDGKKDQSVGFFGDLLSKLTSK